MNNMIALFFDTETTGFPNPNNVPEIVQIGALLQDMENGKILGEFNGLVRTTKDSEPGAFQAHQITQEMTLQFGYKPEVADNIFAIMASKADVIVAHNIDFDEQIVNGVWPISRAIMAGKPKFCTMRSCAPIRDIPRKHAGRSEYAKLADCYRYFYSQDFEGAHDAMVDVRACRDVFLMLIENGWYSIIDRGIAPTQKNLEAAAGV